MKNYIFYLIVIVFSFLPMQQLFAQAIIDTGREAAKGEVNFTTLANYLLAHPEPLIVREIENDEDNDSRPVHPSTLPALIHYRTTSAPPTISLMPR